MIWLYFPKWYIKIRPYDVSNGSLCGTDHDGHRIKDSGDWLQLYNQDEYISRTINWLSSLDRQLLTALQKESRAYAEEHLSWSHSVDVLESMILS